MRYLVLLVALLAACSNNVLGNVNEHSQDDGGDSSSTGPGDASVAQGDNDTATGDNGGGSTTPTGANTDSTGVSSQGASSFLSSLGIATHIGQGIDDPDDAATAMAYAGILNLRDDTNTSKTDDLVRIHQSHGIKVVPIVNGGVMTDGSYMTMAKALAKAGALLAAEGPNEPNNFAETYDGATSDYLGSFMPIANLQKDLYASIKADADTKDIPVFHTSEAGGSEPDDVGLQWLTIPTGAGASMPDGTVYADYANTHNYVCGHLNNLQDNQAWNAEDPTLNGDWDGLYVEYHQTWNKGFAGYALADLPTLPKVTTETGWPTDGDGSISQEQQGRLFMDLYLSAFKQGWSYTFIYMLRDDAGQGIWGLFDTGWNPKKSGTYMHNLNGPF